MSSLASTKHVLSQTLLFLGDCAKSSSCEELGTRQGRHGACRRAQDTTSLPHGAAWHDIQAALPR